MFGKVMSISDDLMWNYYELLSAMASDEIAKLRKKVEAHEMHPKVAKEQLAQEIVARYYNDEEAVKAKEHFDQVIVGKGTPDEMDAHETLDESLVDSMADAGVVKSKGEAKRLIAQGAVKVNEMKVDDPFHTLPKGEHIVKVGKRKFIKMIVK